MVPKNSRIKTNPKIEGLVVGKHLSINEKYRYLFPHTKTYFIMNTNIGDIETHLIDKGNSHRIYMLSDWCKANAKVCNLKSGDRVAIKIIMPMKKYRLEIVS